MVNEMFNKLTETCLKYNITPNEFYILACMHYKLTSQSFSNKSLSMDVRSLSLKKLIVNNNHKFDITDEGKKIFESAEVKKVIKKKKYVKPTVTLEMVAEYVELFPKGKLPSGKLARSDKRNLKVLFEWFFNHYEYSWQTVMKATKLYVSEFQMTGYKYMRTSQYFISKANSDRTRESELANYCLMIINGSQPGKSTDHFSEKVV